LQTLAARGELVVARTKACHCLDGNTSGVTTELVGNCGHGCAPIDRPERHADNIYGFEPAWPIPWTTFAGYLAAVDAARPAVNVAALAPHGTLRLTAMADAGGRAAPDEQRTMERLLDEALDAGAFGLSTGLEYPNRLAEGIRHVVTNGVFAMEDGRLTGRRGGRALRR
jgi:N-acyl-D-amino-acid deacylase